MRPEACRSKSKHLKHSSFHSIHPSSLPLHPAPTTFFPGLSVTEPSFPPISQQTAIPSIPQQTATSTAHFPPLLPPFPFFCYFLIFFNFFPLPFFAYFLFFVFFGFFNIFLPLFVGCFWVICSCLLLILWCIMVCFLSF